VSEELPEGWATIRLGDAMEVVRGASPRPKGDPRYFGGHIPWLKISDITRAEGRLVWNTRDHVTPAGAALSRLLPQGALVLSNSATVCVPKVLGVAACIHDGFVAFPALPPWLERDFLYYYFEWIRPKVRNEHRQGNTQVNLNKDIVRAFELFVPPPPEQHRIVAKVEALLARVNAAREQLERVPLILRRFRESVLAKAFSGDLVPSEVEFAMGDDSSAQPTSAPADRSGNQSELRGDLPEGWSIARLSEIATKLGSGSTPRGGSEAYVATGVPLIRSMNVHFDGFREDGLAFLTPTQAVKLREVTVRAHDV